VTHSARGSSRAERRRRAQAPPGPAPAPPGPPAGPAPGPSRPDPGPASAARWGGSWLAQLPYAVVVIGVAAGLLWMRGDQRDVRSGTLVMAGVLLAGAAARLGLPERRAGLLGSRRRLADAAAFAALGAGLLVAGLIFPVPA
jgi:Protein of unknown function (DUF3017)